MAYLTGRGVWCDGLSEGLHQDAGGRGGRRAAVVTVRLSIVVVVVRRDQHTDLAVDD
jgi:hypothetical protein